MPVFRFVDPDSLKFEAIENENVMVAGGAGIQSAQFVYCQQRGGSSDNQKCRSQCIDYPHSGGCENLFGAMGTAGETVQMFKNGQLQEAFGPSGARFGSGIGRGMGGGGRGRGMGTGMGMRKDIGMMGLPPLLPMSEKGEIQAMKDQGKALRNQPEEVKKKLKELKR